MSNSLRPAGFDYASGRRGYWALLRDGAGAVVILTEHPATLLSMFRAGVLVGAAKDDAAQIAREQGQG